MKNSDRQITLEKAVPGMTLFDSVLDTHGQVLLAKGVVLTENIIASLRRHHVSMLSVTTEEQESDEERENDLIQAEARLTRLFRKKNSGEHDATGLLEQHIRHFRLGDTA